MRNQNGQSMVSLLVAIGIMSVIIAGTASVFTYQHREVQGLKETLASADFERFVSSVLSDPPKCSALIKGTNLVNASAFPIDLSAASPTNPVHVQLKEIPGIDSGSPIASLGNPASPLSPTLKIKSVDGIYLEFNGGSSVNLVVSFDSSSMIRGIRNPTFPLDLVTSGPITSTSVSGCGDLSGWICGSGTFGGGNCVRESDGMVCSNVTSSFSSPSPSYTCAVNSTLSAVAPLKCAASGASVSCMGSNRYVYMTLMSPFDMMVPTANFPAGGEDWQCVAGDPMVNMVVGLLGIMAGGMLPVQWFDCVRPSDGTICHSTSPAPFFPYYLTYSCTKPPGFSP